MIHPITYVILHSIFLQFLHMTVAICIVESIYIDPYVRKCRKLEGTDRQIDNQTDGEIN